jgi:hypothetical protein
MANVNNLPKAQIIEVKDDVVRVKHPDLTGNLTTYLTAPVAAAGVTLTVLDNIGWADNDWFILGYPGDVFTEADDINGAVSAGTSITVTNTLAHAHGIDTPMTRIYSRKIRIMGAQTLTGVQTAVTGSPFDIQWGLPFTECKLTSTQYAYYFAEFSDGAGSPVYGEQSDGVARTGLANNTVEEITKNALNLTNESINDKISREFCLRELNNWQDDVTARRDWSFELVTADTITSTTNENEYALSDLTYDLKHPNAASSVKSVRFGSNILDWMDWHEYQDRLEGVAKTTVATEITASATSCVLTDTYEFAESGDILVGVDTATYTTNTETTATLSGIAATEFTTTHAVGANVWQGINAGKPTKYTIYNDKFYVDVPVNSDNAGIKFKLDYHKEISRLADFSDATDIPFSYVAQYFLAGRIEYKKGNLDKGNQWLQLYEAKMALETKKDTLPTIKRFVPQNDLEDGGGHFYKSTESSVYNS